MVTNQYHNELLMSYFFNHVKDKEYQCSILNPKYVEPSVHQCIKMHTPKGPALQIQHSSIVSSINEYVAQGVQKQNDSDSDSSVLIQVRRAHMECPHLHFAAYLSLAMQIVTPTKA